MEAARAKSLAVVPISRLSLCFADPVVERPPCGFKAQASVIASTIEWMTRSAVVSCHHPNRGSAILETTARLSQKTARVRITVLQVTHTHSSLLRSSSLVPRRLHAYGAKGASALCAAADWAEIGPEEEVTCPACLKIMARQADQSREA